MNDMTTAIPTLTLGDYLYSLGYHDCLTRRMFDGQWQLTVFNPRFILPDMYIIGSDGRAVVNPDFIEAHRRRYGVVDSDINGNRVGERLADFQSEIYPWMEKNGITRSRSYQDQKDLFFVSRMYTPAWDEISIGKVTALPAVPTVPTLPDTPTPDIVPGGLDPTSAVIYDLRQQLAAVTTRMEEGVKRETTLRARLTSLLGKYKPPVRGGGAPTAKWRDMWNAVSAELEKR